jgi:hypothetical protein
MFSLCTRYNILGLVWLSALGAILLSHKRGFLERGQPFLVALFIFTLIEQYFFALGFPAAANLRYPWIGSSLSQSYLAWLLLYIPNLKALTGIQE